MELSEILKQIQPCNMDEPFIFVSYSARDSERVWQDVLKFQQLGYNVWLDEKNLDKTQPSWRSDALEAIRDMYCSLLVFYVSRNSLVSQPCFSELSCTVEEITKAIHNGPVKFVAVDVEPINDIVQFGQEVYQQIRRKDISKAEKTAQAITLNNCIDQFFNSNNEKVRVKPYGMPNRKMDYYEEIAAAFPDDTRVLAVAQPEPVPVAVPAPVVEVIPEPVAVPTPAPAPIPAPAPVAAPAPAEEPEDMDIPEDLDLDLDEEMEDPYRELLLRAIEDANYVLKKKDTFRFKRRYDMSGKQEKNFGQLFNVSRYDILGCLDPTMFGSGKEGIALTRDKLYSSWNPTVVIDLFQVLQARPGKEGYLNITYRDGCSVEAYFGSFCEGVQALLEIYAKADRQGLEHASDAKQRQEAAKKAAYWKEFGFGDKNPPKRSEPLPTDPVSLANFAMSEYNREVTARGGYGKFEPTNRMTDKQIRGALGSYAKGARAEDVLGVMDDTIFKSGKSGFLLTNTMLYNSHEKKNPVDITRLVKIEQGRRESYLKLTLDDHYQMESYFCLDYLAVKMLLQVYIDAKNQ